MEIGQFKKEKFVIIINSYSKKKLSEKRKKFLISNLNKKFDIIDIFYSSSISDTTNYLLDKINDINGLFLLGGDGSFHHLLNSSIPFPIDFKVGLIPFGTLNDSYKNINGTRNFYKSIKMILSSDAKYLKMMNINEKINSLYSISFGQFSNIPYLKRYKKLKRLSYYLLAIKILFSKRKYVKFLLDDKEVKTLFAFILKGNYLAGFKLNKNNNIDKEELYFSYTKMRFLKGLPSYFVPSKKRIDAYKNNLSIKFFGATDTSIDGEKYVLNELNIILKNTPFKIFSFIK